ncbi:hypothetical protein Fcan01_11694 [Folsomia candida]|uniref:Uncharacterized protein n=2 Tax=Folsomia candida TaxID=158441 RepID=A0A226EE24_FOLCA|nr:hypothetical protein Fcan01_11692 [Folsomia candida]OXA55071.1 hypothetical protein Fcan01_11694 [Folsomia candida]
MQNNIRMARMPVYYGVFALICAFLTPVISHPVKTGALLTDTTFKIVHNPPQQEHASLNPVIQRQNEDQIVEEAVPRPGRQSQSSKVKGVPLLNGNSLAFPHKGNILIKTPHDV